MLNKYIIILSVAGLIIFMFAAIVYAQLIINFDLENLRNQDINLTKAYDIIKIQKAWEAVIASAVSTSPIVVGIVDTGVDLNHQEFNSPDVNLGRFALTDFKPSGHGTQVAGIIGANNVSTVTSLPINSPQVNGILSGVLDESQYSLEIRPFGGPSRSDTLLSVSAALESAINAGSRVINMSFSLPKCSELSSGVDRCYKTDYEFTANLEAYKQLFQLQQAEDILFITIAGNNDITASSSLPGVLSSLDNVITIGATDLNDNRADFGFLAGASNFGSAVNISAPGIGVYAPKPGNEYDANFSGTSASAPLVTGVAAIIKSIKPLLTPVQIKSILTDSDNTDLVITDSEKPIGRRLNAFKAVCDSLVLNCSLRVPFFSIPAGSITGLRSFGFSFITNTQKVGQDFIINENRLLSEVDIVGLTKTGNPTDSVIASLYEGGTKPEEGTFLGESNPILGSSLPTIPDTIITFTFLTSAQLTTSNKYFLVIKRTGALSNIDRYNSLINIVDNVPGAKWEFVPILGGWVSAPNDVPMNLFE